MPSYLIASSSVKPGAAVNAILSDYPSRHGDLPCRVVIHPSEKTLRIDDEPRNRRIISCQIRDGTNTYLISDAAIRHAARRAQLARAQGILEHLRSVIMPLAANSEHGLVTEGLGLLFNWIADEQERLTEK